MSGFSFWFSSGRGRHNSGWGNNYSHSSSYGAHNRYNRNNIFAWFSFNPSRSRHREDEEQQQQQPQQIDPKDNAQQSPAVSKIEPYETNPKAYAMGPRSRGNSLTRDKIALLDGPGNELNDRAAMFRIGQDLQSKGVNVSAALDQIMAVGNQGKYVPSRAAAEFLLAMNQAETSGRWDKKQLTKAEKDELAKTFTAAAKLRSSGDDLSNPQAIEAAEQLVASLKTENSTSVAATDAGAPPASNKVVAK